MNTHPEKSAIMNFLSGGGEMGEITRSHNWAATELGPPEQWPLSLRTLLGVVLHAASPMVLFWGKELTCFYNDAYRPTLGQDGKHPAVGKKASELFPEAWPYIGPVLEGVINTGEPVWFEDQFIPIFRNGNVEDVYWTFSYSPVYDDSGAINGVFVTCTETTEKVHIRKALEERESWFSTMSEGTDILIAVADEESNATYFNNAWTELTGRPLESLLNYGWAELIHPEDKQGFLDLYLNSFRKQKGFTGEFRILGKDGAYRWLLLTGPPRFNRDGTFAGYLSASIDITGRKEAEENFNESRERLRAVVESAPFPIGVYVGREMRIELTNQAILDVWGKGNDVVGKLYAEVLPELSNQSSGGASIYEQLDKVYTTGIPFHARNQRVDLVVNGNLQPFYFNYSFTPLFDANRNVYGVMNTAAEITDLVMARMQVEQSEKNFRNIILQAPVAMCLMLGPDHIVEIANDSMIALWGKPREEVMGKPIFEGLPDAREQGLEQLIAGVYTTGETFTANEMPVQLVRHGNPETVYQNFVYEPYRDGGNGTILGVLAISIDVTSQVLARHKIEEIVNERTQELEQANNSLQKSNAELAQFAYIASHDLQEPLRKISVFTQMLEAKIGGSIDSKSADYLNKIKTSSLKMQALIRDVLAFSQLAKENEIFTATNLNLVLDDIVNDYELLIEQKEASIHYKNLPVIEAIPLQMSQLFNNLVSNSLKFARTDRKPVITIAATMLSDEEKTKNGFEPLQEYYHIRFTDNGIGFKPEYATKIFNIFQRLHGKSEYEGTGIGLAMCKKIALNHGGRLDAEGSSEDGAVFNVYLPAKQIQNYFMFQVQG